MNKNKKQRQLNGNGSRSGGMPNVPNARHKRELVTRSYTVRVETMDEKNRSIEAILATEAQVEVFDWSRWEIITEVLLMSGCRLPANGQVPLQDSHDRTTVQKQLGSCRNLKIEGEQLVGRNFFSSSSVAEHPWTLVREGHLTDNSIGYRVYQSTTIEKGKSFEVMGKQFTAPIDRSLRIVSDWELKENSVCSVGADEAAKNRNENINFNRKELNMDFKKWLEARSLVYNDLSEEQRTKLQADFEAEQKRATDEEAAKKKAAATPAAKRTAADGSPAKTSDEKRSADEIAAQAAEAAVKAERERVNTIRTLAGDDVPAELIERCISEGTGIDEVRAQVLEAVRKNRPKVGAPAGIVNNSQMTRQTIEDAILLRAGFDDVVLADKAEGAKRAEIADKMQDINLLDVCRHAIMLEGQTIPAGREDTIRAAFSTSSLAIILGAIVNKSLLKGYNDVPQTWIKWCNIGSAPDFKTITRARLTDTGSLEEVGSGGEVHYGGAEEEYEQYNISTYAKNFAVTRQQIINDDLGALTRQPRNMGIRANQKVADLVYTSLLANSAMQDTVALFHATHSNLNTTAALAAATLRAAITAFYKQTDKDGKPIGIAPKYLVVPPDLMLFAMELTKSAAIIIAGTAAAITERGAHNVLADLMLEVVSDPRMSNSTYTGYSTTTWYLTADPRVTDTLEVAFLNGKQTPTLERFNPGPDRMGLVSRVYHDAGVKPLDHRTMQKNTA